MMIFFFLTLAVNITVCFIKPEFMIKSANFLIFFWAVIFIQELYMAHEGQAFDGSWAGTVTCNKLTSWSNDGRCSTSNHIFLHSEFTLELYGPLQRGFAQLNPP